MLLEFVRMSCRPQQTLDGGYTLNIHERRGGVGGVVGVAESLYRWRTLSAHRLPAHTLCVVPPGRLILRTNASGSGTRPNYSRR